MTAIDLEMYLAIDVNATLTAKEKSSLMNDLKNEIKSFIYLKVSDLALKHPKLLNEYELEINFGEL